MDLHKWRCARSVLLCMIAMLFTQTARAETGVGLSLGNIEGLSLYHELDQERFIQGVLSVPSSHAALSTDIGFRRTDLFKSQYPVDGYFGIGGVLFARGGLGARIPLGLMWKIPETPLQLSGEIAPTLVLVHATYVSFALTLRWLF